MIDADPSDSSRLLVSSMISFAGKSIHPAITVLEDDETSLLVKYNFYVKPR